MKGQVTKAVLHPRDHQEIAVGAWIWSRLYAGEAPESVKRNLAEYVDELEARVAETGGAA